MAYCHRCDRYFGSERALEQHIADSSYHYLCDDCDRDFTSWNSLVQHYVNSPRHFYCQRCDEHFDDWDDLESHYLDEHYYCSICRSFFKNDYGLQEHNRQRHYYCVPCRRHFQNQNNLDAHMRSSTHRPLTFACPGRGCNRSFVSASARVAHWESGTCPSGVTRQGLADLAVRYDRQNIITDPTRLLRGADDSRVTDTWATDRAWNGSAYECFLCARTFATLPRLNAHLRSAAHADAVYRCPPQRRGCARTFGTLAALCAHVESQSCGVRQFQREMEDVMRLLSGSMRLITV